MGRPPSDALMPGTLPDVAEPINPGEVTTSLRPTPELPGKFTDLTPAVIVGTGLWTVALVVLLVLRLGSAGPPAVWLWTCVAGVALGFLGLGIITWQRAASRRGSKGAQRGL
jgi:hypothetical protein